MKMQTLVLLAAALVAHLTEGRILSKCELKKELEAAAFQLPGKARAKGLTEEDFIAKVVCHVEKTTGFNTSVVTELTPDAVPPPRRAKRRASGGRGMFNLAKYQGRGRGGKTSSKEDSGSHEGSDSSSGEVLETTVWNLYGLFQLSDHVICSSGSDITPNLCQMNCVDLIDDDISDDIKCVETIKMKMENGPADERKDLKRMFMLLFQKDCFNEVAAQYFGEC